MLCGKTACKMGNAMTCNSNQLSRQPGWSRWELLERELSPGKEKRQHGERWEPLPNATCQTQLLMSIRQPE